VKVGRVEAFSNATKISAIKIFKDFVGFNYDQNNLIFNSTTNISYYEFNIVISDPTKVCTGMAIFQAIDITGALSEQHVIYYVFNSAQPTTTPSISTTITETSTISLTNGLGVDDTTLIMTTAILGPSQGAFNGGTLMHILLGLLGGSIFVVVALAVGVITGIVICICCFKKKLKKNKRRNRVEPKEFLRSKA
jgi:uncharacterized protein YneF (UPF0154 family)